MGRFSLAMGHITLHTTLHISRKRCAWTESGPKNVPRPNRSDVGPIRSSNRTCTDAIAISLHSPNDGSAVLCPSHVADCICEHMLC